MYEYVLKDFLILLKEKRTRIKDICERKEEKGTRPSSNNAMAARNLGIRRQGFLSAMLISEKNFSPNDISNNWDLDCGLQIGYGGL